MSFEDVLPVSEIFKNKFPVKVNHVTFSSGCLPCSCDNLERILRTDSTCRRLSLCSLPVIVNLLLSGLEKLGLEKSEPIN